MAITRNGRMRIDQFGCHVVVLICAFPIDQLEITAIDLAFFVRLPRPLSTDSAGMKSGRMRDRAFAIAIVGARSSKMTGTHGPEKPSTETSDESFEWR